MTTSKMPKKLKIIRPGDPMPDPCIKCSLKHGYQVTDSIKTQYTVSYTDKGEMDQGFYSEYVETTKFGSRVFCSNCGHDLKLKIDRT